MTLAPDEIVGVQVPASSANLGPGFDAFAVALDLRLVAVTREREERRVVAEGEGTDELPADETNLVWRCLSAYCRHAGVTEPDVTLCVRNPIPLQRGLGSSAAAAVAGVTLGRALTGGGGTDDELIALVTEVEGHADNAAAALLGGLVVVASTASGERIVRRLEPTPRLCPVVCVPSTRQATTAARDLLPAALPTPEAAANAARAALVLAGLVGLTDWDPALLHDTLHEPPRLDAMGPMGEAGALVAGLRAAGLGACLSGAGPSVLALVEAGDREAIERVRTLAGDDVRVLPLGWDVAGAAVCPPTVLPAA